MEDYADARLILKMAHGSISDRVYKNKDHSHSMPSLKTAQEGSLFYQKIEQQLESIDKRIIDRKMKEERNI